MALRRRDGPVAAKYAPRPPVRCRLHMVRMPVASGFGLCAVGEAGFDQCLRSQWRSVYGDMYRLLEELEEIGARRAQRARETCWGRVFVALTLRDMSLPTVVCSGACASVASAVGQGFAYAGAPEV